MIQLREYQKEIIKKSIKIISSYGMVYLSLEVRTGKTLISLYICKDMGFKNVLFVTKKKAMESIKIDSMNLQELNVNIINYESLHKLNFDFDIVIIDEAHSLGAYPKPSNRTVLLKQIVKNKPIIYLSGTPTPESYSQIYHQFWVSANSPFLAYRNFYKWAHEFVNIKKMFVYNRELNDYSNAKIDLIDKSIKHLFISFTQEQAGFEHKIIESILYCDINDNTHILVKKLLRDKIYNCKDGDVILADTAVKLQSKIHQIFGGSVKSESGKIIKIDNSKAIFIKDHFKGMKIAIFYKFIGEKEILKEIFKNYTESPEEFQQSDNKVFIGQFISSREGIRLDTADAIIFYNIDFSYLSFEQSKNRIISKERTKEAVLYWIFAKNGIESKIYKAVSNKKDYTNYYFKRDYDVRKSDPGKID